MTHTKDVYLFVVFPTNKYEQDVSTMDGLLIIGVYVAAMFTVLKLVDIKFIQKNDGPDTTRILIRDSVTSYLATVMGIYIAIQLGGIAMGGATSKGKSVFTGMPDF